MPYPNIGASKKACNPADHISILNQIERSLFSDNTNVSIPFLIRLKYTFSRLNANPIWKIKIPNKAEVKTITKVVFKLLDM